MPVRRLAYLPVGMWQPAIALACAHHCLGRATRVSQPCDVRVSAPRLWRLSSETRVSRQWDTTFRATAGSPPSLWCEFCMGWKDTNKRERHEKTQETRKTRNNTKNTKRAWKRVSLSADALQPLALPFVRKQISVCLAWKRHEKSTKYHTIYHANIKKYHSDFTQISHEISRKHQEISLKYHWLARWYTAVWL